MVVHTLALVTAGSVVGGLVSLAMVVAAWRNREMPAAPAFGLLMAAISGWCFFAAAFLLAGDTGTAYLFNRLVRLTSAHVGALLLVFVLSYAGYTRWLTRKWIATYWLIPTLYLLLSLTGRWNELAAGPEDVVITTVGGLTAPVVRSQTALDVQLLVSYILVLGAYWVLFDFYRRSRSPHRHQIILIVIGAFVPFVVNVAFSFGVSIHPGIDPTPMTFTLSGVAIGWALFRYDFLDAAPVVTDLLVDQLPDPVVVLDEDDYVVDFNPAALSAFGHHDLAGLHVSEAAPGLMVHLETGGLYSLPPRHAADGGSVRFYDPQVSTIDDQHGSERGRLVVLRDVTGQQRRQDRLEALQEATQQFITATTQEEIARLTVDFVEEALDRHAAGVFIRDGNVLRPAAVTDSVREFQDEEDLVLGRDTPMFQAFEAQEQRIESPEGDTPIEWYAVFPLGDHGVLGIGSRHENPLASDDEQFVSILSRTTQVALTQVKRERELRESRVSIERRSEQIEFFNGVLRHTLRNALLVIQGRANYLDDVVDEGESQHLDVITEWCDDLATLSDEIRAINETVTATESERLDVVDLTDLLYRHIREFEAEFPGAELTLDVEDGVDVLANELAGRVVESVILNALDHNDADEPQVEVRTQRAADRVQVYVVDNGPGMADDMKETVLKRDLAASQTSHGFGLYFVSVMMNLYGGTIWFEDSDPGGTVACLEFKAAE